MGNKAVDELAKRGADAHRAPEALVQGMKAVASKAHQAIAWIDEVPRVASYYGTWHDVVTCPAPEPVGRRATCRARLAPRLPEAGGHQWHWLGHLFRQGGWRCDKCAAVTRHRDKRSREWCPEGAGLCLDTALCQTVEVVTRSAGAGHFLYAQDDLVWCGRCGFNATMAAHHSKLAEPCRAACAPTQKGAAAQPSAWQTPWVGCRRPAGTFP